MENVRNMKRYRIIETLSLAIFLLLNGSAVGQKLVEYLPEKPAKTAIVVCPGGSYYWLAKRGEGSEVAQWLNQYGYAAYVLEYPVSGWWSWFTHVRRSCCTQYPGQLNALGEALKTVKSKGYSTVGAMGFSAGGHLVLSGAELLPDSTAPDFVAAIYPVVTMREPYVHKRSRRGLLGERRQHDLAMRDSLSMELHADKVRCPVFLLSCDDDPTVDWQNAAMMADSLKVHDKPCYIVRPESGGHGFGVNEEKMAGRGCMVWPAEFLNWLQRTLSLWKWQ